MVEFIKALIFDFDGLILDTESSLVAAWQEIYDEYNLVLPLDEWAGMLGQSADPPEAYEYLEAHLGAAVNREMLKERRIDRELMILEDQAPMPGVQALIQETTERGLLIAVASSSEHAWVDEHLDRLELSQYFNVVICADDVEFTKPASDLYIRALHELGVGPEQAIALEDSEHGVSAARSAGLFCIAIPNAITQSASFEQANLILGTLEGFQLDDILNLVSGNE